MSTGLTSEQQRRIEENKKKAKERLARKRPFLSTSLPSTTQTFPSNPETPRGLVATEQATVPPPPRPGTQTARQEAFGKRRPGLGPATKEHRLPQPKRKCLLTLASRTRFQAVTQYDSALIDLFKRIPSKSYGNEALDAVTMEFIT